MKNEFIFHLLDREWQVVNFKKITRIYSKRYVRDTPANDEVEHDQHYAKYEIYVEIEGKEYFWEEFNESILAKCAKRLVCSEEELVEAYIVFIGRLYGNINIYKFLHVAYFKKNEESEYGVTYDEIVEEIREQLNQRMTPAEKKMEYLPGYDCLMDWDNKDYSWLEALAPADPDML